MLFTLSEALCYSLFRILWKMIVLNYKVMQIISKKISTYGSTMPIKYSKKADLRPLFINMNFVLRLHDIQNYAYSVFIIISDYALVCIGSISFNYSTLFNRCFSHFMIFKSHCSMIDWNWIFTKQ